MSQLLNALKSIEHKADDGDSSPDLIDPELSDDLDIVWPTGEASPPVDEAVDETANEAEKEVSQEVTSQRSAASETVACDTANTNATEADTNEIDAAEIDTAPADVDEPNQHAAGDANEAVPGLLDAVAGTRSDSEVTLPHWAATFTVDAATLQLCNRVFLEIPSDQTTSVAFFRAGATGSNLQVVSQLAVAMATQTGRSVLAIDVDPRRAERSGGRRGAAPPGLNESLLGEMKWPDVIVPVGGPYENVSVMYGGSSPCSTETIGRLPSLIDQARRRYPLILIDGGLVAAGSLLAASRCCDLVYLVVGLGQTDRSEAADALSALQNAGFSVQGCVVTRVA